MASWQAHTLSWLVRVVLNRKLQRATDAFAVRRAFEGGARKLPAEPIASVNGVPGEWLGLESASRTLLYLHGGGYVACSSRTHRPVTQAFAKAGLRVFAPDYRLAPEHPFPAALDDAVAAYSGLAGPVVVAGDSAGGGLAVAMMLRLRELGLPLPIRAVLFSPWTDLAGTGTSVTTNAHLDAMFRGTDPSGLAGIYAGTADVRNPLLSPVYGDLAGLPPLLIHVGRTEMLLDDSLRLADHARATGVSAEVKIWPVVPHAWQLAHQFVPEGRQSMEEATRFLLAG